MPAPRDPFANLDPSKLVDLDGKEDRPAGKRPAESAEPTFAPPQDTIVLELDVPPPRRGTTAPQPPPAAARRPSAPLPQPRTTDPVPRPAPPPSPQASAPVRAPVPTPPPPQPLATALPAGVTPRLAFAGGMALALAIGFLPAHLYASLAERRYDTIRREATHVEPAANDEIYRTALEEREAAIARLGHAKHRIVVFGGLIWIVSTAGLGYAWLRWVQSRLPAGV